MPLQNKKKHKIKTIRYNDCKVAYVSRENFYVYKSAHFFMFETSHCYETVIFTLQHTNFISTYPEYKKYKLGNNFTVVNLLNCVVFQRELSLCLHFRVKNLVYYLEQGAMPSGNYQSQNSEIFIARYFHSSASQQ